MIFQSRRHLSGLGVGLTLMAILFSSGCSAAPKLSFQAQESGLTSLRYGPTEFLAQGTKDGAPLLSGLTFEGQGRLKGSTPQSTHFDAALGQLEQTFAWGRLSTRYQQADDRLNVAVTLQNTSKKSLTQWRLSLARMTFPRQPDGQSWDKRTYALHSDNIDEPTIVVGDYGMGVVAYANDDVTLPLDSGFYKMGAAWGVDLMSFKDNDVIAPGESRNMTVSLRFGPAGSDYKSLGGDVYRKFAELYPRIGPNWPDRRPIAALHPSSYHLSALHTKKPVNRRGWLVGKDLDSTTPDDRRKLQDELRAWFARSLPVMREMNAQGAIIWSLEGQQYPHATSYLGSPDLLPQMAPEMDEIADEIFKMYRDNGFKVGVCIRPQMVMPDKNNPPGADINAPGVSYEQEDLWDKNGDTDSAAILEHLDKKINYAKKRWGATLFYVDTNVAYKWETDQKTGKRKTLLWERNDFKIYRELTRRHPDCMIIPEHENFAYWSGSAPLGATPDPVLYTWPDAFSVNLMQGFKGTDEAENKRLEENVRNGDILLFQGWYNAPTNGVVKEIYRRAHNPKWHDAPQP